MNKLLESAKTNKTLYQINIKRIFVMLSLLLLLEIVALPIQALEPTLQQVVNGDLYGTQLGSDMAISGDTVLAGEMGFNASSGRIRVYTFDGTNAALQTTIPGDTETLFLGSKVAIDGNLIVAGMSSAHVGGLSSAGQARVYTFDGSTVTLVAILNGTQPDEYFGSSVAVDGSTIVIGAAGANYGAGNRSGRVSIYTFDGATVNLRDTIDGDQLNIRLGHSVDISGNTIVATAPYASPGGILAAGQARVYSFDGSTATLLDTINGDTENDELGRLVRIDGNIIAVGSNRADPGGLTNAGQVRLYTLDGATTTLRHIVNGNDAYDQLGSSIDVSGNTIAIGIPGADIPAGNDIGQIHLYTLNGTTVSLEVVIDGANDDGGFPTIALEGDRLVAGSPGTAIGAIAGAGRVKFYTLGTPPPEGCFINAPESVNENSPFTATVACNNAGDVYGFEYDLNIDPSSPMLFPQDTAFTPGDIFDGLSTMTLINNLDDGYAVSLQREPAGVSGDVTLGSIGYDTDDPGTALLTLDDFILGDINGLEIPNSLAANPDATIIIVDLALASFEGSAKREAGLDLTTAITVEADGVPPDTTGTAGGYFTFSYAEESVATDAELAISAPGHLGCLTPDLGLPDDTHVVLTPITLLAGDVNGDGEINITDASIIVSARIGDPVPPGSVPDLDEDGRISILDLIHVGRNYGETVPDCLP